MIRPRLLPSGHPDRQTSVEESVEAGYKALVVRMMARGMTEQEVVLAVESLSQAHLDTIVSNANVERAIDDARALLGLPSRASPTASLEGRELIAPPTPDSVLPWVIAGAGWSAATIVFLAWVWGG